MSDFYKYIEFDDGHVAIFHPTYGHKQVAEWTEASPVSAGMCCFDKEGKGRFFGSSSGLNIAANKALSVEGRQFYSVPTWHRLQVLTTDEHLTSSEVIKVPWCIVRNEHGTEAKVPAPNDARLSDAVELAGIFFEGDVHTMEII